VARLKPGISLAQAQAEMNVISKRLEQAYPETNEKVAVVVVPMRGQVAGDTGTALLVLFAASACVLLIACANVANLLLARASGRQREIAVRLALGAGRSRLVRQMLGETLALAGASLLPSLAIAAGGLAVLEKLVPATMAEVELNLDWRLMSLTMTLGILSALAAGVAPALAASGVSVSNALKQGGTKSTTGGAFGRRLLVAGQVALAVVLLVGAGLLLRSFATIRGIDPGFRTENLLTARTILQRSDPAVQLAWAERVLERVRTLPGVRSAAFASNLPFTARGNTTGFLVEGAAIERGLSYDALYRTVTNDYLNVLGVRLREGRIFSNGDGRETQPVVVINETFARTYFDGSPIGRRVQFSTGPPTWYTVVGVVGEIRERGFEAELKPGAYVLLSQAGHGFFPPSWIAVRTAGDPMAIVAGVREAVRAADPAIALSAIRTMEEVVDLEVEDRQQQATVLGALAATALLLACVGLYGVLAYTVARRTREIGVRVALGATRSDILRRVTGDGLAPVLMGGLIGLLAAAVLTRAMRALLFGVTPLDPATYGGVAGALLVFALVACIIPARRATAVDPVVALREE
jgi:putative ABC transport system permease protein